MQRWMLLFAGRDLGGGIISEFCVDITRAQASAATA
jgi:hypothetical protein